jgi:hypothetical protein|eukprot:29097-Pelagococcus_subviridis.AAC.4
MDHRTARTHRIARSVAASLWNDVARPLAASVNGRLAARDAARSIVRGRGRARADCERRERIGAREATETGGRGGATDRAAELRCVLNERISPIARFQHLIASPFN